MLGTRPVAESWSQSHALRSLSSGRKVKKCEVSSVTLPDFYSENTPRVDLATGLDVGAIWLKGKNQNTVWKEVEGATQFK